MNYFDIDTTPNDSKLSSRKADIVLDDQVLDIVIGQRGKELLVYDGFLFSKNNAVGTKQYWACRTRNPETGACRARVTTIAKPNGLHYIIVTRHEHNHHKTRRMIMKLQRNHKFNEDSYVKKEINTFK